MVASCHYRKAVRRSSFHVKRGNENLPLISGANEIVRLSPFPNNAAVRSRVLPFHCGKHTPPSNGLHRQFSKATAAGALSFIAVSHILKKRDQLLAGLKTMDRPVSSH